MSEFFKALEQAERDRQLAEAAEPTASVTVDAKGKTPDPASAGESEQAAEKLARGTSGDDYRNRSKKAVA